MLPFQKPRRAVGLIINKRKPDGEIEAQENQGENEGLTACAEDMIRAISAKDAKALADALCSAFECLESYENPSDEDYDAQNIKAAQDKDNE